MSAGTLRDHGFRFIRRGHLFQWVHPADVRSADLDCTDMSDDEFECAVLATGAAA